MPASYCEPGFTRVQGSIPKKPNGCKPQYYKLHIWMGLDLSPIASFGLYMEVSTLAQLAPTPCYNTSFQRDTNGWTCPGVWCCTVTLGEKGAPTPVAYDAASTDTLYTTMEEIASGTCRVDYLEPWFADGRVKAES